jgi:hypothetical protein
MNFGWQEIISLLIVVSSAFLLVRGQIHRRRRAGLRTGCAECGCNPGKDPESVRPDGETSGKATISRPQVKRM